MRRPWRTWLHWLEFTFKGRLTVLLFFVAVAVAVIIVWLLTASPADAHLEEFDALAASPDAAAE